MSAHLDQVLTVEQMRAAEAELVDEGIPVDELMRRAGEGAARWIWRISGGRPVTVLCGPGNNGGDGYVIARSLRHSGCDVTVVSPFDAKDGAAARARESWEGEIRGTGEGVRGEVLVDCLFGYGLSRGLSDELQSLLHRLAQTHHKLAAVDVPSGVESDSGKVLSPIPHYDLTLALGAWKQAHCLMPARSKMGRLELVDIGIGEVEGAAHVVQRPRLRAPDPDAHKYTRGLLTIVAGEMPGAAMLSAKAAMRAGAGYVKLLSDHSHPDAPAGLVIDNAELADVLSDERIDAILVGPGLGRSDASRARLVAALQANCAKVLDADALHLLDKQAMDGTDASRIFVAPHEGELAKLCETFGVRADSKLDSARRLAEASGLTVLAKGADTILAAPGEPAQFFPPASSWLSTAGTGDVLAGIAASRLAHHGDPAQAVREAVFLHSEAAHLCGPAFTADDLAETVSSAYARFL